MYDSTTDAPEPIIGVARKSAFRQGGSKACFVCGTVFRVGPHHVIPRSEGGLPLTDNIVWLCRKHHDEVEGPAAGAWQRIYALKGKRHSRSPEARRAADERAEMQASWYVSRRDLAEEPYGVPDDSVDNTARIEIKRIWEGGPLRQWSHKRATSRWIRHDHGWAGMYVCDDCKQPTPMGVYSVRLGHDSGKAEAGILWLCAACREARRGRQEQPPALRAYITRKREEGPSIQI